MRRAVLLLSAVLALIGVTLAPATADASTPQPARPAAPLAATPSAASANTVTAARALTTTRASKHRHKPLARTAAIKRLKTHRPEIVLPASRHRPAARRAAVPEFHCAATDFIYGIDVGALAGSLAGYGFMTCTGEHLRIGLEEKLIECLHWQKSEFLGLIRAHCTNWREVADSKWQRTDASFVDAITPDYVCRNRTLHRWRTVIEASARYARYLAETTTHWRNAYCG